MKFRREAGSGGSGETRDEVRELAETLSLYRSAMCHVAEREAARPWVADRRRAAPVRFRLLLAPALAAAVAAAVMAPVYSHMHHHRSAVARTAEAAQQNPAANRASIDDTALMNQIDSAVTEDVPDALRPLADMSEGTTTTSSVTEKTNVTHE